MAQITGPFKLKKNIFNRRRKQREEDALNAAWAEQQRNMDNAAQSALQQMTQHITDTSNRLNEEFSKEQAATKFLIPKSTIDPNFSLSDITNAAIRDIEERERIAREKAEQERLAQERLAQEAIINERENARREQRIQDAEEYGYEAMNVVGHPQIVQKERKEGDFIPGISLLPKEEKPEYGIHTLDMPEPFQPRFIEVKSSKTTQKQKPKPLIKKKNSGVLPSTNQAYNQYISETNEAGGTPVTQFIYEATSQQYPFRTAKEIASTSKTTQNKNNKSGEKSSTKKTSTKKTQSVKVTKSNNPNYNDYVQQAADNGVTPVSQWIFEATTQKYPHLTIDQIISQAKATKSSTKQPTKQSSTQPVTPLILQNNNKSQIDFTQPFWMNQREHRW